MEKLTVKERVLQHKSGGKPNEACKYCAHYVNVDILYGACVQGEPEPVLTEHGDIKALTYPCAEAHESCNKFKRG